MRNISPYSLVYHSTSEGEYLIYVQPDTGRIFPEAGALESDPHYLQRFQWLIDSLGADKIVDVLWLQEQMRKGWPDLTPIASPTSETAVDRFLLSDYKLFLPLAIEQ